MALKPASLQWLAEGVRSTAYGDIYFQRQHGPEESHYVFLEKNSLPERFSKSGVDGMRVAELGFGTGLNFLLTLQAWHKSGAPGELFYASIEKHPILPEDLKKIFSFWPELQTYAAPLLAQYPPLLEGFYHLYFPAFRARLMLCLGDVAEVLPQIHGRFDAWYLDGFSPAKNPAMWDERLFPLIAERTAPGGTLATFSAAAAVRQGLAAAGFEAEKVEGFGVKRVMTVARMAGIPAPRRAEKVTVIGAGLAGASAAYACARRGFDVTVIDRQPAPAQETSGNPVGVLYPKLTADRSPAGLFFEHGFYFTRNLVTALALPSWNPCGMLQLDTSAEEAAWHKGLIARGHWPPEVMAYEEGKGMAFPLSGFLSPPELCRRLLEHLKIKTVYSKEISSLPEEGVVIVASGYDSRKFAETAWLPLRSVRGQMTFLRATQESQKLAQLVCHEAALPPAVDGIHYAGATFSREEPAPPALREDDNLKNLEKLNKYLPQMGFTAEDILGARAGYRAAFADHLPAVGPCPDHAIFMSGGKKLLENLYLMTGFSGHGLTGAPLAGDIVASMIAEEPLPLPQAILPFIAPERFILRSLK